jgi:hypothetical protein
MGAPESADHGEKGSMAAQLTSGSNCEGSGVILGELRAWEGCSPRVRTPGRLESGGGAVEPRVDGGGAPTVQELLWCAWTGRSREGEGTPKGVPSSLRQGEAHRGTGRGTGATAATEQAVDVGGRWRSSRFTRAERERARELGRGRKWERGGG